MPVVSPRWAMKKKATGVALLCGASDALEDAGGPLAHADAHGHHAVLQIFAAQRVDDCRRPDSAGRAERMPERDRSAHRVDPGGIEAERVDHCERLRGESFVELDPVDGI